MLACERDVQRSLCQKDRSVENFKMFADLSSELQDQFEKFLKECCAKSEVCQYLQTFQHIATTIKHIVSSDREGNFLLHIANVERSLPIFRESDCNNYLRYGAFYLESTRVLEVTLIFLSGLCQVNLL